MSYNYRMKLFIKVFIAILLALGIYMLFINIKESRRIQGVEKNYPALKTDYSTTIIPSRESSWMIWDVKEKGVTINGGSVFDEKDTSKNLTKVCSPKEVFYKETTSIYDCGDFYTIFILGNPPSPKLYGPFNK